ncbi:MAG: hypothetical protein ACRC1T_09855 [Clostridium chrysemydis]|uniref:hypothetical protein n=1 Tax=Clostridium chrysemydis TaxID=2665504 RepID=UPI003F384362
MEKLLEKALRGKFRYNFRGMITTEDLWDLKIHDLNTIYVNLNSEFEKTKNIGLLQTESKDNEIIREKMEIVKHIFTIKKQEIEDALNREKKKAEKLKLMELIARKEEDNLSNLSLEELKEKLNNMEA